MNRQLLLAILWMMLFAAPACAEEGMWLFNAPPRQQIKAKYGFELTDSWLRHLQLSSVRFNVGGSGSFVSPDGLAFTNHHVASDCLQGLSSPSRDYLKTGFYATSRANEPKCPNLELNVLQQITDVTAKVNSAVRPGMTDAQVGTSQRSAMAGIEKECANVPGTRCDVVMLYSGAMFHLYRYKKYTDVRLVFAPEFQTAFFGGDPDNFEYPRYDLDITFFRVYENGRSVHLEDYLRWSPAGAKDDELVFVSGHPGSTSRLETLQEIEFLRDVQFPFQLKDYKRRISLLHRFAAESVENARIAQEDIFGLENSFKAVSGYNSGLSGDTLRTKVIRERRTLLRARRNPALQGELAAFRQIGRAIAVHHEIFLPYRFFELRSGFRGDLNRIARFLVRAPVEKKKPNGERLREYRDSNLESLEQEIFSTAPIYKSLETLLFADSLTETQEFLGANNPVLAGILEGKTPQQAAAYAIAHTQLDQVAVRRQLYEGGVAAIERSSDPLITIMRKLDSAARALRKRYDDEVEAVERRAATEIAKARFREGGLASPPDATFTLRLSYGRVKGYVEDGRGYLPKGSKVIPFTDFSGAYRRAAQHGNKTPYQLASSWVKAKSKINLKTPLNFTSTPDIIGGNSGSPVVNESGEIVGIIFDGNIQSLPWDFVYEDVVGRAVSVDSRGIQEALRNIYGATELANELKNADAAKKH